MKSTLLILFFICVQSLFSQEKCYEDSFGNCIEKGKVKIIKVKTSFGMGYKTELKKGTWMHFSPDGNKIASGEYKIIQNSSLQEGVWEYYNSEGVVFMRRTYLQGVVKKTEYLDTGCYRFRRENFCSELDSLGNIKVSGSSNGKEIKLTTVPGKEISPNKSRGFQSRQAAANSRQDARLHKLDSFLLVEHPRTAVFLNSRAYSWELPTNHVSNGGFEVHDASENMQFSTGNDKLAEGWSSSSETPDLHLDGSNAFGGFRVKGTNFEVLRNKL